MWQKVLASLLVMMGAQGFGMALCQDMKSQQYHLQQQKQLIRYIIEEIDYMQRPVREILEDNCERLGEPYQSFVKEVARNMNHEQGRSLWQIWEDEIIHSNKNSCYSKDALESLHKIGKSLGCQEDKLQLAVMQMLEKELEEKLDKLKKEKEEKSKLIQTLSLLVGALCIVIFL